MKLLILGTRVLGVGPFSDSGTEIISEGTVYPKVAMIGWFFVDVETLPVGFDPEYYNYSNGDLVPKEGPPPTREELKTKREAEVASLKVTTQAGNTFDGDETSQGRMSRAIIALQATNTPSTVWVLADNTVIQATSAELTEALVLAGQAQAAIWVIPG